MFDKKDDFVKMAADFLNEANAKTKDKYYRNPPWQVSKDGAGIEYQIFDQVSHRSRSGPKMPVWQSSVGDECQAHIDSKLVAAQFTPEEQRAFWNGFQRLIHVEETMPANRESADAKITMDISLKDNNMLQLLAYLSKRELATLPKQEKEARKQIFIGKLPSGVVNIIEGYTTPEIPKKNP